MKKIFFILAVVLVMAAPIFAQNTFADVPRDHWAYDAVSELESMGLVIGYPDGTFQGKRTLSRYEFAMVISRMLPFLDSEEINVDGFARKSDLTGFAKTSDIKNVDLTPYATKDALVKIEALAKEFQSELAALGVDVNVLKADVAALKTRVAALEDETSRIKINGSASFIGSAAIVSGDDSTLYNYDGNVVKDGVRATRFTKDFQIDVKARVNDKINAYATIVLGDYDNRYNDGEIINVDIIPYYMYAVSSDEKYGDVKVGRMPFQINPYVMKRLDNDSYADIARLDNGDYSVDGVDYKVKTGAVDWRAWAVKPTTDTVFDEVNLDGSYNFISDVAYNAGIEIGFNFSNARISGLFSRAAAEVDSALVPDEADIYGGQLYVPFGQFCFDGSYFVQSLNVKDEYYDMEDPSAWDAKLGYANDKLSINAGYKEVEAGYATPGAWDKIGSTLSFYGDAEYLDVYTLSNPDNIKGFYANAAYNVTDNFKVYGSYKDYQRKDDSNLTGPGDITTYKGGVEFALTNLDSIYAEYEEVKNDDVDFDYYSTSKKTSADYNWNNKSSYITVGWLRKIGTNAKLKLMYQYVKNDVHYDDTYGCDEDYENKGSIVNAQVSVDF